MGTNYYHVTESKPACEHCGRSADRDELHIGKSSFGWEFGFRGYDEGEGPRTLWEWTERISQGGHIEDEYGKTVTLEDFLKLVEAKRGGINSARLSIGKHLWRPVEFEYRDNHPRDLIFGFRVDKHWLDGEGHGFSNYEFS